MGIWDDLRSTAVKLTASDYPSNTGKYNRGGGHETDLPVSGAVRAKNPQKLKYYAWILDNISKLTVDSVSNRSLKGIIGGGSRVPKKGKEGSQDEKPLSASYEYFMEKLQEEEMNRLEQKNKILSTHNTRKKKLKENGFSQEESIDLTPEPKPERIFIRSRL